MAIIPADSKLNDVTGTRVLMMPDSTAGNAYQRQLAGALESLGAQVVFADPQGVLPLTGTIKRHGPIQVLHLHWTHPLLLSGTRWRSIVKSIRFLFELAILRLRNIRVVWTAHNLAEHERRFPGLELFFGRLSSLLYGRIIVHCDVAADMVSTAYRLSRRQRKKLHTIPHGHFIGSYPDQLTRWDARARLGLAPESKVFVHFGQIRPYKGIFELLEVFSALNAPTAQLVIAGKPWNEEIMDKLERCARLDTRIKLFLGFVPDDEVQLYMNAADAAVLPYRDILTSGSAMLAMSFGRAVIMPRCGCAEAMLGEPQNALLYSPSDARGLAGTLEAALKVDLTALGEHNRRRAAEFAWHDIALRTSQAYIGHCS